MAGKIFINYRRDDSISTAGRLHDRLAQRFGRKNLFMDVDHIPAGVDFVDYLHSQVAACDVFLAVIGPNWLDVRDDSGRRRFDDPDDFVTIEIAAALARNIRVIPVLVDGARTPKADKLPDSVKPLVRRNAVELRNTYFGRDAETLANSVREALTVTRPARGLWPFMASAAARLMAPGRWRTVAGSAAALLLVGWIGLYQMGVPVWVPWTSGADPPRADKAKAAAVAEAQRKATEAEQTRLKEEEQRQGQAVADAEVKRKAAEAEQQRLKEEEQRQAKAAADPEVKRKAAEAEQQRLKEEEQRQAKAAADAEARRKATEAEQQQLVPFAITNNTEAIRGANGSTVGVQSIRECEAACAKSPTCKIFTYEKEGRSCHMYSNATLAPNEKFDTGIRKSESGTTSIGLGPFALDPPAKKKASLDAIPEQIQGEWCWRSERLAVSNYTRGRCPEKNGTTFTVHPDRTVSTYVVDGKRASQTCKLTNAVTKDDRVALSFVCDLYKDTVSVTYDVTLNGDRMVMKVR
jgi:TIR domain/PAN domain